MKRRSQMTANRPVLVPRANPVRLRGSAQSGIRVKTGIRVPAWISADGIKRVSAPVVGELGGTVYDIPLEARLDMIRCTFPTPCQKCHYCLTRQYGEQYWLQRMPP